MSHEHTPGPWTLEVGVTALDSVWDAEGMFKVASFITSQRHDTDEATANARLIAAAPLLEMIAQIAGTLVWASMSEYQRHALTEDRKADILAAYRAYCGFRDGKLTMDEAWEEVSKTHARYEMEV